MIELSFDKANELGENEEVEVDGVRFELYQEGDWEDSGKYQHSTYIYKSSDNKFYSMKVSRSGSYYTDDYYQYDNLHEVELREITVTTKQWVLVR